MITFWEQNVAASSLYVIKMSKCNRKFNVYTPVIGFSRRYNFFQFNCIAVINYKVYTTK